MIKYLYIALGFISLALGFIGIVTPGLPTTPFILLTAFLFAKGSPRLHKKLLEHPLTGKYIHHVNEGFSTKAIVISISLMWCMILPTIFLVFKNNLTMQYVMISLGFIGTITQIIVLRKKKKKQGAMELKNTLKEEVDRNLKIS